MKQFNKKTSWLFLLLFFGFSPVFSQNALIMLKFEDAEKAYNNGNYTEAMQLLNDVEKAAGVTSKTLYLRIVVENKQFDNGTGLYDDIEKFNQLQKLRQHATKYLNALANQEIDVKYREVYQISGNLKDFPNTLQEWENEQLIKQRQQQEQEQKKETAEQKADEYEKFSEGLISANELRHHQVAHISMDSGSDIAVVYLYRPKRMYHRRLGHPIQLNDATIVEKIELKEYVKLNFTPGLLKIVGRKNSIIKSPIILNLEAGKTYYVRVVHYIDGEWYLQVNKNTGEKAMEKMKEIKI